MFAHAMAIPRLAVLPAIRADRPVASCPSRYLVGQTRIAPFLSASLVLLVAGERGVDAVFTEKTKNAERRMTKAQKLYDQVLRDAVEAVLVVAVRRAIDTRFLVVEFDAGREPGLYQEHTLTISVRDFSIAVTADGIPHDWLAIGTGYIDMRFSKRVALLLHELDKKAQAAGHFI